MSKRIEVNVEKLENIINSINKVMNKKEKNKILFITHWSGFHADDVMACSLIETFLGDVDVLRVDHNAGTGQFLKETYGEGYETVIVADVGGEYDKEKLLFDHHQFSNKELDKAAAGLIFDWLVEEGKISSLLKEELKELMKKIDYNDIGLEPSKIGEYSWIIWKYNSENTYNQDMQLIQFKKAVKFTEEFLKNIISEVNEKEETINVINSLEPIPEDKRILEMDNYHKGWDEAILNNPKFKDIDVVIWTDKDQGTFKAQTMPKEKGSFEKRGRAIKVQNPLETDGMIFVHQAEFFAVAKDRESMMKYLKENLK